MTNYNYTLSEVLKTTRLEKNITLDQIELQTKIRASYIKALEEGIYSNLPADIYIRGILKNYANFLELDYSELLKLYRKEVNMTGYSNNEKKHFFNIKSFITSIVYTNKLFLSIIFIIISILIAWFIFYQYSLLSKPPEIILFTPPDNFSTNIPSVDIYGKTEINTEIRINGQKVPVKDDATFQETYNLSKGQNTLIIEATSNKNKKSKSIERHILFIPPTIPPEAEATSIVTTNNKS